MFLRRKKSPVHSIQKASVVHDRESVRTWRLFALLSDRVLVWELKLSPGGPDPINFLLLTAATTNAPTNAIAITRTSSTTTSTTTSIAITNTYQYHYHDHCHDCYHCYYCYCQWYFLVLLLLLSPLLLLLLKHLLRVYTRTIAFLLLISTEALTDMGLTRTHTIARSLLPLFLWLSRPLISTNINELCLADFWTPPKS